ncbi:MAG: DUF2358 domain-containing protein [Cyanobacteria bacterium P01_F01_bin.53]
MAKDAVAKGDRSNGIGLVEQLRQDYARFPDNQTYELYAENVQFTDPMNAFEGVEKYRKMIGFLARFFSNIKMDLHAIEQPEPTLITTQWTLHMDAPLPWSPRLSIPGRSELGVSKVGLIHSHIDYWHCSKLAVLMQVFGQ